jgi:hypothetical protein
MAELAGWAQLLPELAPVEAWFVMTCVSHAFRCKDHSHRDRLPVACSTCAPRRPAAPPPGASGAAVHLSFGPSGPTTHAASNINLVLLRKT